MSEHIEITLQIGSDRASRIPVVARPQVLVQELLAQVCTSQNLSAKDYALVVMRGDFREQLNPQKTLGQNDISSGMELYVWKRNEPTAPNDTEFPFPGNIIVALRSERTNRLYRIRTTPCLIGRSQNNQKVDIDLSSEPHGETVSSRHAQILLRQGIMSIKCISERNNPIYLNYNLLRFGEERRIFTGDRIRLGRVTLRYNFTE